MAEELSEIGYRAKLHMWPGLAERIVAHVDEGRPLHEGIEAPLSPIDVHLVTYLWAFKHASPDRQADMAALAHEHINQ